MLLDLIFPPKCIFCGRLLEPGTDIRICVDCHPKIIHHKGSLSKCFENKAKSFDKVIAACEYEGIIREALIRFKFYNKPGYGKTFASLLLEAIRKIDDLPPIDMIMSVPLHKKRKRTRGYNQSLILARHISRWTGIPERSAILARVRNTDVQSLLDAKKRAENVQGAFSVTAHEKIKGKKVLLIDDIITTGSTIDECCRVLKEAGVSYAAAAAVAAAPGIDF